MRRNNIYFKNEELPKALQEDIYYEDEPKKIPKKRRLKKRKKTLKQKFRKLIFLIILLLFIIFIVWGTIRTYTWISLAKQMTVNQSSEVLDTENNIIATIGDEKIKQNLSFNEIPTNLVDAYVSIEDERFYTHHGIDIKRTGAAIVSYVINFGSSSFGGSTITQQLVKNLTGEDSPSISRKVKEWIKAITLEWALSKEEILEVYLNIIYVGPNIYGVGAGAQYYFDKDISDLTLAECAFLAGINHSPNSYNPFTDTDRSEKIEDRTKTVLYKMLELEYITQLEYDSAIEEVENGLSFSKGDLSAESDGVYSYHTDALYTEIIEDISEKKNISTSFATNYISMAGLTIYSTQDSSIQEQMEDEFERSIYILQSSNDSSATSQAAMVIIEQSTGYVVGTVGGLGEKTEVRPLNRATQSARQTGSAIKPIAILAPALNEKIITPVSIYLDEPTTFDDGTEEGYSPVDYDPYLGSITVRRAVESSQNIPFVTMLQQLTPKVAIEYLEKMGITTLTENDQELPLALGGLEKGMTPLETAAAYAMIANNGVYIEPTFYTKIETSSGKTVIKSKQSKKRVISESAAYVLQELLTQPVEGANGTATYCYISGIDVAAKTGTTNENYDRWLCGFTPYYTAATWFGFDLNETIVFNGINPAGLLWSNIMSDIHSNLSSASFEMPKSGVVTATICATTGKIANSGCTDRYTEYFVKGTLPESCTLHSGSTSNVESNRSQNNIYDGIYDDIITQQETLTNTEEAVEPKETTSDSNSNNNNNNSSSSNNDNNDDDDTYSDTESNSNSNNSNGSSDTQEEESSSGANTGTSSSDEVEESDNTNSDSDSNDSSFSTTSGN